MQPRADLAGLRHGRNRDIPCVCLLSHSHITCQLLTSSQTLKSHPSLISDLLTFPSAIDELISCSDSYFIGSSKADPALIKQGYGPCCSSLKTNILETYLHACFSFLNATTFLSFAPPFCYVSFFWPYYTQIHRTAFLPLLPFPSIRPLYFS